METGSKLDKAKHIGYWKRCVKSLLPHQYTSNDSNRMALSFFIVSALDLLGCLDDLTTFTERCEYANWIYRCQHPQGGFRGSPATDFGELRNADNQRWDPANLPATYFALATLVILRDDLERVEREQCLQWLTRMQRSEGSFGESLGKDGKIEGGTDARFGYCATGVRWILRGTGKGPPIKVEDIDVDGIVRSIGTSQVCLRQATDLYHLTHQ